MEADYVATYEATKKAVWLRKFLTDLKVVPNIHLPIILYYDKNVEVANSREPKYQTSPQKLLAATRWRRAAGPSMLTTPRNKH